MDEAYMTVVGWVAAKPQYRITSNGVPFLSVRVGVTPRRFVRETGQWTDQPPTYVSVSCWRALAENINASELAPGTPVIAQGRLRVRDYEHAGQQRIMVELQAAAFGPDLNRGKAHFQRRSRSATTIEDQAEPIEPADHLAGRPVTRLHPAQPDRSPVVPGVSGADTPDTGAETSAHDDSYDLEEEEAA
ncbi:single-stranded DNA-binding protein [Actinocorallia lasiicapitis]